MQIPTFYEGHLSSRKKIIISASAIVFLLHNVIVWIILITILPPLPTCPSHQSSPKSRFHHITPQTFVNIYWQLSTLFRKVTSETADQFTAVFIFRVCHGKCSPAAVKCQNKDIMSFLHLIFRNFTKQPHNGKAIVTVPSDSEAHSPIRRLQDFFWSRTLRYPGTYIFAGRADFVR